jgi:hypothetical protein
MIQLQRRLPAAPDALRAAHTKTQDAQTYRRSIEKWSGVNHRITLLGGLIFREQAKSIASAAKKVEHSKDGLVAAIKKIEKLTNVIKAISGFLSLVDKVIDLAKVAKPT